MYFDHLFNFTPEIREEMKHAELCDAIDAMTCQMHGEHSHWRMDVLVKVHDENYGEISKCKFCTDSKLNSSLSKIQSAFEKPALDVHASKPEPTASQQPNTEFDKLPEPVKRRLQQMKIDPSRIKVTNGVIEIV